MEKLPGADPLLDRYGATRLVLYRKDRFGCLRGDAHLREFRLRPDSTTRRVVAICCNSPMFLDFTKGHWVDLYGQRWLPDPMPQPELRTMTMDLPKDVELPGDISNARRQSLAFFGKLIMAWIAMGFRTPKIAWVKGDLHVSH